jgi:hypothetical protein
MPEGIPGGHGKCTAIKADGSQCQAWSMGGYDKCNFHSSPTAASDAGYKGSQGNRKHPAQNEVRDDEEPVRLETPNDVLKLIERTVDDVRKNRIRPDTASMVAYLGNVALQAMRTDIDKGAADKPMPEIKEIERSGDARATAESYPGSDFGAEEAN